MTVWLVGRRSGARRLGGDQLQMEEAARFGARAGWQVQLATSAREVRPRSGDRVHLFNIQRCLDWGDLPERSKAAGAKLLLSPLYHPLDVYHLEGRRGLDRFLAKVVPDSSRFAELRWGGRDLGHRARTILKLADRILLSHPGEAELLNTEFGVPLAASRTGVIPVAVPANANIESAQLKEDTIIEQDFVLCAGRIEPLKNTEAVGRACAGLELPLIFAGPAPGLRHVGYVPGAMHGASWTGELDYPALRKLMSRARVHVLASWTEVVGRVSLEAALSGASGVLSNVGFCPDYLGRDTEGVFLFEPGDDEGLTRALEGAWARGRRPDSELVRRVQERYTWEAVGPRLMEAWAA